MLELQQCYISVKYVAVSLGFSWLCEINDIYIAAFQSSVLQKICLLFVLSLSLGEFRVWSDQWHWFLNRMWGVRCRVSGGLEGILFVLKTSSVRARGQSTVIYILQWRFN